MNNSQQLLKGMQRFRRFQFISAVFSLLLLVKAASATDATTSGNHTIVPGHSIGKVWIGAPRDAVQKVLGKPTETHQRNDKIIEDVWMSPRSSTNRYKVFYLKNRVIQIETSAPVFSAEGFSLRSDPYQIRKKFGRMRVRIYNSVFNSRQFFRYYYDNAPRGITFSVRVHGAREVATRFQSVIVHRKGHDVTPETGETFLSQLWDEAKKKP